MDCDERNFSNKLDKLEKNLVYLKENSIEDALIPFLKRQQTLAQECRNLRQVLQDTETKLNEEKSQHHVADVRLNMLRYELDAETKKRNAAEDIRDELTNRLSDLQCLLEDKRQCTHNKSSAPTAPPQSIRKLYPSVLHVSSQNTTTDHMNVKPINVPVSQKSPSMFQKIFMGNRQPPSHSTTYNESLTQPTESSQRVTIREDLNTTLTHSLPATSNPYSLSSTVAQSNNSNGKECFAHLDSPLRSPPSYSELPQHQFSSNDINASNNALLANSSTTSTSNPKSSSTLNPNLLPLQTGSANVSRCSNKRVKYFHSSTIVHEPDLTVQSAESDQDITFSGDRSRMTTPPIIEILEDNISMAGESSEKEKSGVNNTTLTGDMQLQTHRYLTRRMMKQISKETLRRRDEIKSLIPFVHQFMTKKFYKPENCVACSKKVNFGRLGLRCQQCSICVHVECQVNVKNRCALQMREISGGLRRENLIDFCPSCPPYIPPLIYYCVKEIEIRGLQTEGLYRHCSNEAKVRALRNAFIRKRVATVDLAKVPDVHTLCSTVKEFLSSLSEPLITYAHWHKFAAAKAEDPSYIPRSVKRLPLENQHTLAYMMLHLFEISKSTYCRMCVDNLCKIFGPVIVANSSPDPSKYRIYLELSVQQRTMQALFSVERDYWMKLLLDARQPDGLVDIALSNNADLNVLSPLLPTKRKKASPKTPLGMDRTRMNRKSGCGQRNLASKTRK